MTIEKMKELIRKPYPHPGWQDKVDRMRNDQIAAVYFSFKKHGLFNKKKKRPDPHWQQMTLWDL